MGPTGLEDTTKAVQGLGSTAGSFATLTQMLQGTPAQPLSPGQKQPIASAGGAPSNYPTTPLKAPNSGGSQVSPMPLVKPASLLELLSKLNGR